MTSGQTHEDEQVVFIDPRTKEPCCRCDGTGKMPPWPGSKGSVVCGVCRAESLPPQAAPESEPLEYGWLPNVLHRASLESLVISWVQDKATNQELRDLRDRIHNSVVAEKTAPTLPPLDEDIECRIHRLDSLDKTDRTNLAEEVLDNRERQLLASEARNQELMGLLQQAESSLASLRTSLKAEQDSHLNESARWSKAMFDLREERDRLLVNQELLKESWEALNFILAFYDSDANKYLDTNAWKNAEAGGRRVREKLKNAISLLQPPAISLPSDKGEGK